MNKIPAVSEYRKHNPNTEAILIGNSGMIIVIDRYGVDDYGAWWTVADELYNDSYGCSVRGPMDSILKELKEEI